MMPVREGLPTTLELPSSISAARGHREIVAVLTV